VDTFTLTQKEFAMPRTRPPYPEEYRKKIVELVRAGRTPYELAKEFEPTVVTIRSWVKQADLDEGRRKDGMTTSEREELRRLRRENKRLRLEREILAKAAAWFAQETNSMSDEPSSS
jgi:transposase